MPLWARAVAAAAAALVALGLTVFLSGQTFGRTPLPHWVYFLLSASYATVGATLIAANRRDVRAAWLGGVLLLIGLQAAGPFLGAQTSAIDRSIGRLRPDAFLPAFLWMFVIHFPSELGRLRRPAGVMAGVAVLFGVAAAAVNISLTTWPPGVPVTGWRSLLSTAQAPGSAYWSGLFGLSLLAFVALLARAIAARGGDRFRIKVFVGGLLAGFLPMFLEVMLEEAWPAFKEMAHRPGVEPWVGFLLFAPLATVPFTTTYSVVYDRVVDLRIALRAAIQYALARYLILTATLVPLAALAVYLYQNRQLPLGDLLTGTRPVLLGATMGIGAWSFRVRDQLLRAIDRRYFREQYDTQLLMANLLSDALLSRPPAEIAAALAVEIDRAMHARADVFVLDDDRAMLVDARGSATGLPVDAVLVGLALADAQPMDVTSGEQALARLPARERDWLAQGPYGLLMALRGRDGSPVGMLAFGAKASGQPYLGGDRRAIGALSAPLALALENERLRRLPESAEPPARECANCSRVLDKTATQCTCGGSLQEAQAPRTLRGVYRFEQRIGAGGMGVVYRATDLTLGRSVAIKTLPRVTPEHVTRLRREAQAMALMEHPNLAVIHGVEMWRGVPFLIAEFLAGGTLAHALAARRPLAIGTALDYAITLTGVVGKLHEAGIIHCDLKPSNIGFTQAGSLKVLDFGLAHLLRDPGAELTTVSAPDAEAPLLVSVSERGVAGTPAYMCPEASRGERPGPGFDQWSLAVVLFEMVAGRRPFSGDTSSAVFARIRSGDYPDPRSLRPDCPAVLAGFFARAFALNPAERFPSVDAMRAELFVLRGAAP